MGKQVVRFSSIGQYRDIITSVAKIASHNNEPLPTLRFRGLVKLHGTNAAIVYDPTTKSETNDGIQIQSRNNVYGPITKNNVQEKDQGKDHGKDQGKEAGHMGFNEFAHQPEIVKLVEYIYECCTNSHSTNEHKIMIIYGEWAGKGIMKNVAISEFEKGFYIFGILCYPLKTVTSQNVSAEDKAAEDKEQSKPARDLNEVDDEKIDLDTPQGNGQGNWYDIANLKLPPGAAKVRLFNLMDFEHWELDIDFKDPKAVQNRIVEITNQVEKVCPVGYALGTSGIGEGVVWQTEWKGYRLLFKVKGTQHSISKVKTLASVDPEEHASIHSFLEYAVTENRVDQALHEVGLKKGGTSSLKMSDIGELMKWITNDILKEESDVLKKSNLEWSKVSKPVVNRARSMFQIKLNIG